jgi:hypothetical protein
MIKIAKAAVATVFLAVVTMVAANAQTANTYRTNLLLNLTFSLTSYQQGYTFFTTNGILGPYAPTALTGKIATDGVIRSIAKDAKITGDLSNAKLYMRLSWTNAITLANAGDLTTDIIIRRGTEDIVVNNYILVDLRIALLTGQLFGSVRTLRATVSGTLNVTEYANCNVSVGTTQGSFALHGIATVNSASLLNGRTLLDLTPFPTSFTASVTASGGVGFHPAAWKGTVMGSGAKVEIQQVSP